MCTWEKMVTLAFEKRWVSLRAWVCQRERARAREHCQTKRVLSQQLSSFLPRQLGRATPPPLPPLVLPLPPSSFKSVLLHAISCSLHSSSLFSHCCRPALSVHCELVERDHKFWKGQLGSMSPFRALFLCRFLSCFYRNNFTFKHILRLPGLLKFGLECVNSIRL